MAIPISSLYPDSFDSDDNLFLVHDGLRMTLSEDYNPGDTSIVVDGDAAIIARFPPTGIITLTEQCSPLEKRAISFYYGSITTTIPFTFNDLEILPEYSDTLKPKLITHVTLNVLAEHHNSLKDSIIALEKFAGKKGIVDKEPFGETLEGRINFLRKLVLVPRAWFSVNKRIGVVPFEVEFTDLSFRLASDEEASQVTLTWDFGDGDSACYSTCDSLTLAGTPGGTVSHTYCSPGYFNVKLTVSNIFGEDICEFQQLINARIEAPYEAFVQFIELNGVQDVTPGSPLDAPYITFPKIRSPINTLINIEIPTGELGMTGISYAGEVLNGITPCDPIKTYTWSLSDDLIHENGRTTQASYSVGGIYDMKIRCDTEAGAYRITTYEDSIDIVENVNLWLWLINGNTIQPYEYGLISETFKAGGKIYDFSPNTFRDDSFLDTVSNSSRQKSEFRKNTGFAPTGTSGGGGSALIYHSSGRSTAIPADEYINVLEYNGFKDLHSVKGTIARPWNWATFSSTSSFYVLFGGILDTLNCNLMTNPDDCNTSPTNDQNLTVDLITLSTTISVYTPSNFKNGAEELQQNVVSYDGNGIETSGHFSTYRTAFKDDNGYILRNNGVDPFFRIRSFYRTEGTFSNPIQDVRKLTDMPGPSKEEGQLTPLSKGVYFFNNSGGVTAYITASGTWSTGGPGVNSASFRSLQDDTVPADPAAPFCNPLGFSDQANTCMVASDGDKRAYITYDYSPNVFLKFSEIDNTFTTLGSRPTFGLCNEQWMMGIW